MSTEFSGDLGLRRQLRDFQNRKRGLDISIERKTRVDQATRIPPIPTFSPRDSVRTDAKTNKYTLVVLYKTSQKSQAMASHGCFAKYGKFIRPREIEKRGKAKTACFQSQVFEFFFTKDEPLRRYNLYISAVEIYSDVVKVT
jgi:hypothetical protein